MAFSKLTETQDIIKALQLTAVTRDLGFGHKLKLGFVF